MKQKKGKRDALNGLKEGKGPDKRGKGRAKRSGKLIAT